MTNKLYFLILLVFGLVPFDTFSQTSGNNPLVGNWRLQALMEAGDTIFNANDNMVFENWYRAKIIPAGMTLDTSAFKSMKTLEQLFIDANATFTGDGKIIYDVALDKNKKGIYRLAGSKTLLIKWGMDITETKAIYRVKNDIFCYYEQDSPSQVYYFKKTNK